MNLTEEDIALYLDRGFYISPVIFTDDELDAAVLRKHDYTDPVVYPQ